MGIWISIDVHTNRFVVSRLLCATNMKLREEWHREGLPRLYQPVLCLISYFADIKPLEVSHPISIAGHAL